MGLNDPTTRGRADAERKSDNMITQYIRMEDFVVCIENGELVCMTKKYFDREIFIQQEMAKQKITLTHDGITLTTALRNTKTINDFIKKLPDDQAIRVIEEYRAKRNPILEYAKKTFACTENDGILDRATHIVKDEKGWD